ncbi:hypothetical protein EV145_11271 [Flavobacterium sp. 245]|nr:hypothetical protein EV145_11271 [Flavobacterium sp. 245]
MEHYKKFSLIIYSLIILIHTILYLFFDESFKSFCFGSIPMILMIIAVLMNKLEKK